MFSKYLDKYVVIQTAIISAIFLSALITHTNTSVIVKVIGLCFLSAGVVILAISIKNLGSSLTPVVAPKQNSQLVTSGIYGIVRHPMYSGVIFLAIGWSLFSGSLLSLLFSILLIIFFVVKASL